MDKANHNLIMICLKMAFGGIINGDLCKTSPFAQFLRQTQILILEILNVFLWLKSSSSPPGRRPHGPVAWTWTKLNIFQRSLIFNRRGFMISSPCKNCSRKNLPKDNCIKNCKLLQAIQDIQISAKKSFDSSGIDYTEENRYTIPNSITKNNDSLWTIWSATVV